MAVGTDTQGVVNLPEVHRRVLVAHERHRYFLCGAGQIRQWGGNRVDVLHRRQRYRRADHVAQPRRPDASRGDHEVGLDVTLRGLDRGDAAVGDIEAGHLDVAEERRAVSLGLPRHRLGRPGRLRVDV